MNKFATGMLLGGAAAMAGMGYLMKDKRTYQRLARKGKKMVVKAEEAIDDIKGKGIILMFSKGGPFLLTPLSYHSNLNSICTKTKEFFKNI